VKIDGEPRRTAIAGAILARGPSTRRLYFPWQQRFSREEERNTQSIPAPSIRAALRRIVARMHLEALIATVDAPRTAVPQRPRHRDRFFLGMAVAAVVSMLLGFARTYYLKAVFPTPSFPALFHIHGALFTTWMFLLVLQVSLVATRRTALHRRVGWIGLPLMVQMAVTGTLVSIAAARGRGPVSAAVRRGELTWVPIGITPTELLFMNLVAMLLFAVFAAAGLAFRRRPEVHKRFMMLATIGLLPAAIGRAAITLLGVFHPALLFGTIAGFILAMAVHDRRRDGHLHPVTLWGGLILIVSVPARLALAKTGLWLAAASWLIQ
jgi:hypothetical protein